MSAASEASNQGAPDEHPTSAPQVPKARLEPRFDAGPSARAAARAAARVAARVDARFDGRFDASFEAPAPGLAARWGAQGGGRHGGKTDLDTDQGTHVPGYTTDDTRIGVSGTDHRALQGAAGRLSAEGGARSRQRERQP
jgi:hypothetical protein